MCESNLSNIFAYFGTVKAVQLEKDPKTMQHNGFAVIEYDNKQGAEKAIECMDSGLIDNKTVIVRLFTPQEASASNNGTTTSTQQVPTGIVQQQHGNRNNNQQHHGGRPQHRGGGGYRRGKRHSPYQRFVHKYLQSRSARRSRSRSPPRRRRHSKSRSRSPRYKR